MNLNSLLAAQGYAGLGNLQKGTDGEQAPATGATPAADFAETLRNGEAVAMEALAGRADPQSLVTALAQTELAVETAVTVRDKVVEAYQEILRMPV